jgi:branched-chain amino acid transport system permease protein
MGACRGWPRILHHSQLAGLCSGQGESVVSTLFLQQIANGLLDGVYYLLIALGLSLIFSLGGIVNLAHGAFYAIGAYLTVLLGPHIGFGGALIVSPLAVALLGIVFERLLFQRFYRADPILSLLLTFGLALVAEQALRMIFGAPPLSYSIPTWLRGQIFLGDFIYSRYRATLIGIAALCVIGLWFLLNRTAFGRVVKAGVQNPDMVGALGISLNPYMMAVAGIGIGLAGLAGVLLAPIYSIHPAMGQEIITPAFVVVVIGGLGSFWGVVVAALLVGFVKGATIGLGFPQFSTAVIYLMMLLVLLFRPRGLFGERIQRFE